MPIARPVLIVDDEFENVRALEEVMVDTSARMHMYNLKESRKIYDMPERIVFYAAHPEEAIDFMKLFKETGVNLGAIVSDNHFLETVLGEDFLSIVAGNAVYSSSKDFNDLKAYNILNPESNKFPNFRELFGYETYKTEDDILEFLEYNFSDINEYREFVRHFSGINPVKIMFCGHPDEIDENGIGRVDIVQKCRSHGELCEREVLSYLCDRQILPQAFVYRAMEDHYRLSSRANANQRTYKEKR
jgi:hypothetical protein